MHLNTYTVTEEIKNKKHLLSDSGAEKSVRKKWNPIKDFNVEGIQTQPPRGDWNQQICKKSAESLMKLWPESQLWKEILIACNSGGQVEVENSGGPDPFSPRLTTSN